MPMATTSMPSRRTSRKMSRRSAPSAEGANYGQVSRSNLLAVEHIHRDAMGVEDAADELVQRRIVGGELLRACRPGRCRRSTRRSSRRTTTARLPPSTRRRWSSRSACGRRAWMYFSGRHRRVVGLADLGVHLRIDVADAAAHDRVRELVHEDVLAVVARARDSRAGSLPRRSSGCRRGRATGWRGSRDPPGSPARRAARPAASSASTPGCPSSSRLRR